MTGIYDVFGVKRTTPVECPVCGRVDFAGNAHKAGWDVGDKAEAIEHMVSWGEILATCHECQLKKAREK